MRELYTGTLKAKKRPEPNPFWKPKEGETEESRPQQIGSLWTFTDGSEEWINTPATDYWLKSINTGGAFLFVKEWSVKKKNKETGELGAYVYRPVLNCAGDITQQESNSKPPTGPLAIARENYARTAGQAYKVLQWLRTAPLDGSAAPIEELTAGLDAATVEKVNAGVSAIDTCLVKFGKLAKVLDI